MSDTPRTDKVPHNVAELAMHARKLERELQRYYIQGSMEGYRHGYAQGFKEGRLDVRLDRPESILREVDELITKVKDKSYNQGFREGLAFKGKPQKNANTII